MLPISHDPSLTLWTCANQARYSATDNGDGTVWVNFPHASDPDSEPFRGTVNDHLEYHVYGGTDSDFD